MITKASTSERDDTGPNGTGTSSAVRSLGSAQADLAVGLGAVVTAGWVASELVGFTAGFVLRTSAVYAATALLILYLRPIRLPGPGVGLANRVTLARLVLALPVAALVLEPGTPSESWRWLVLVLGGLAVAMDGVDGWIARRTGTASPFGARFDMETDAALIMVLSWLAWSWGDAGMWVLGMGAMRYLFVAAAFVLPALNGELFPSFRRKVVCVVQSVSLLVALSPLVPREVAFGVLALALVLLTWSFAVDTAWLVRQGRRSLGTEGLSR